MKKTRSVDEGPSFIQKTSQSSKMVNRQKSERKMLIWVAIKFVILFLVISMSDMLLDWLLSLFDIISELIHLVFEAIEYSIELLLEYIFNTNHQQSEIIIINSVIIIVFYLTYRTLLTLPRLYLRVKRNIKTIWLRKKRLRYSRWREMPLSSKIKLIAAYILGTTCLVMLI